MKHKITSLFVLIMLITGTLHTPAQAQGGISVSISAPSSVQPNTPVTLTAEVTENGAPKSGVTVTFFVDGAPIGDCTTDALGKCQIGHSFADSGEYTVSVSAEGSSDSTTIVVGGTNTPLDPLPTRTPTPLPPMPTSLPSPTRTNTPNSSTGSEPTASRTPFFFNPSRTPTATRTPTPLNIPSSTPTTDLFVITPRITTATPIPTHTPRPTAGNSFFTFPTLSQGDQETPQITPTPLIDLSTVLTVVLSFALVIILILIFANFRRFRRLLWRLFRF